MFALTSCPRVTMIVRAAPTYDNLLLAATPGVEHCVMAGANDQHAALVREGGTSFGERINVMQMEDAPAVARQARESALSVG